MSFCVSCGKENKASAKFCTGCGKAMVPTGPAKVSSLQAQGSIKTAVASTNKLIIGVIGLVLAILAFLLLTRNNSKPNNTVQTNTAPVTQNTTPLSSPAVQTVTKKAEANIVKENSPAQQPQTDTPVDAIKNIIGQHYALIGNNDCYSINNYYEPVLENYYNRRNLNRSEVLTDCVTYQKRWPINSTSVDYNSLQVTNLSNGSGYLVTYHLNSSLKKIESDDWKTYSLFITIHFTDQLKIKSIYEIKQ
jgi:hypothetical protein